MPDGVFRLEITPPQGDFLKFTKKKWRYNPIVSRNLSTFAPICGSPRRRLTFFDISFRHYLLFFLALPISLFSFSRIIGFTFHGGHIGVSGGRYSMLITAFLWGGCRITAFQVSCGWRRRLRHGRWRRGRSGWSCRNRGRGLR